MRANFFSFRSIEQIKLKLRKSQFSTIIYQALDSENNHSETEVLHQNDSNINDSFSTNGKTKVILRKFLLAIRLRLMEEF